MGPTTKNEIFTYTIQKLLNSRIFVLVMMATVLMFVLVFWWFLVKLC